MLKKVGIAIAVALALLMVGGGYLWCQATALPDWYTEADAVALDEYAAEDAGDAPPPGWVVVPHQDDATAEPTPPAQPEARADTPQRARKHRRAARHELRGFHRRGKKGSGRSAVKASRATYENGKLEAGVIFDLSRIPKDKLVERDRELYDRAVDQFPGITHRDVYIGIEDRPVTKDGVLQLGPSPKVRVGNLRYSLDSAARKIGMTPAQLRHEFDRELQRLGFVDPNTRD